MIFRWLNNQKRSAIELQKARGWTHKVVGEGSYQTNLLKIAGKRKDRGKRHYCDAILICENHNVHDSNAVAVTIGGETVGYLCRDAAEDYRGELSQIAQDLPDARVSAVIVGGWKDDQSEGSYGVKLNLKRPVKAVKE